MYSKNCDADLLNDAMKVMFTQSLKSLDSIPPTQHALFQHAKRALLAAAFIWKQSLSKIPKIPKPSDWGWEWNTRTNQWVPFWTDLADVSHACSLLLHCGCVVACRGNCKCHRTGLRCSTLSKCEGGCTNNVNKAIRDGKYLALPQSSAWRRFPPPLKSKKINRDVISLLARVFIFLIDRATQEVAIKIFERNCRSSFWDTHHWIVRLAAYWRCMTSCIYATLHLYTEYIDLPGVCIQQFVMIHWLLQ